MDDVIDDARVDQIGFTDLLLKEMKEAAQYMRGEVDKEGIEPHRPEAEKEEVDKEGIEPHRPEAEPGSSEDAAGCAKRARKPPRRFAAVDENEACFCGKGNTYEKASPTTTRAKDENGRTTRKVARTAKRKGSSRSSLNKGDIVSVPAYFFGIDYAKETYLRDWKSARDFGEVRSVNRHGCYVNFGGGSEFSKVFVLNKMLRVEKRVDRKPQSKKRKTGTENIVVAKAEKSEGIAISQCFYCDCFRLGMTAKGGGVCSFKAEKMRRGRYIQNKECELVPVFCNGEFTTTRQHEEEIRDFVLNLVGCETADGTDGVENGGFNFDFTEL